MSRPPAAADPPRRPALPSTGVVLVCVAGTEALVLRCGWEPAPVAMALWAALAAALALTAALLGERCPPLLGLGCVACASALMACLSASLAASGLVGFSRAMSSSAVSRWTLEVTSDPSLGDYGYGFQARASADGQPSGSVWVSWGPEEEPRLGERLRCVGSYEAYGDDEWGTSSRARGIAGSVRVARVLEREPAQGGRGLLLGLRERSVSLLDARGSESGALLAASVCGYGVGMDAFGLDELFSRCGVSHLVAVSGGHISVICGILSATLEGLGLGLRSRSLALVALSGLFVLFCGAPASAVRSWLMVAVALGATLLGRRSHALSAVIVVASVIALASPFVSGQLGFALSVVSVAALCVFPSHVSYALGVLLPHPRLPRRLRGLSRPLARVGRSLRDTLAATLVAQVACAPLTIPTFSELSLVAPLANILLAPLFSALIGCGMLGVAAGLAPRVGPAVAHLPLMGGHAAAWLAICALRLLARLPLACVTVLGMAVPALAVASLVALYVAWPRVRRGPALALVGTALAVAVGLLARWRWLSPARVVVLDVGQGDAILVQEGGASLLVDTGPDDSVVEALAREHVLHLDAILLTHLHADHTGGLDDLVGVVGCERVLVARGVAAGEPEGLRQAVEELTGSGSEEVSRGDVLEVGGFSLEVVSPVGEVDGTQNADSIELALRYERGGRSLTGLLTGDAEGDETAAAIARGDVGDVDFLKVGHHGSAVSLTPQSARALDAEVAVASAGEGNSYGHPTPECVATLEDAGSLFLCTKDVGDVEVRPGGDGPRVSYDGSRPEGR